MDKILLGAEILKRLNYIQDGIDKYNRGHILYSEEPYGLLYDLTAEMQSVVNKLKSRGWVVYAVISGAYHMGTGDIMRANTYLCLQ